MVIRKKNIVFVAALVGGLAIASQGAAQGTMAGYSDRAAQRAALTPSWQNTQGQLTETLRAGQPKDWYRKQLETMGFQITSVNYNDDDYVEYEVVRGANSYEVQIDINEATQKATEIEIDANLIQAEGTEKALAASRNRMEQRKPSRFSDSYQRSTIGKTWYEGQDMLQRSLKPGQDRKWYRTKLEGMGYTITSVNYNSADYVEYEVVKGPDSYEVQIDIDDETGKAEEIEIDANLIQAEATEKALKKG